MSEAFSTPSAEFGSTASRWPRRLAVTLVVLVWPLIWVGGLVTTYDAGMSVPDWPGTYGYNLLLYPISTWLLGPFDLFIEHGHRLLGALVGFVAIGFLIACWRTESRTWVKWLAVAVLVAVIGQGVLGGLRVTMSARTLAMVHGCTGPIFFALCVVAACVTGRRWRGENVLAAAIGSTPPATREGSKNERSARFSGEGITSNLPSTEPSPGGLAKGSPPTPPATPEGDVVPSQPVAITALKDGTTSVAGGVQTIADTGLDSPTPRSGERGTEIDPGAPDGLRPTANIAGDFPATPRMIWPILLIALTYTQLVLGAIMRHALPMASPMGFAHTATTHVSVALLLWAVTVLAYWRMQRCGDLTLSRPAAGLICFVGVQILLGVGTWIVNYGYPPILQSFPGSNSYVLQAKNLLDAWIVTGHVATGSLILAVSTLLAMRLARRRWVIQNVG